MSSHSPAASSARHNIPLKFSDHFTVVVAFCPYMVRWYLPQHSAASLLISRLTPGLVVRCLLPYKESGSR